MHAATAAAAYKRVSVSSAAPSRVLDELFCRLRRDLATAHDACTAGEVAPRCRALAHAMQVVAALDAGLDPAVAPGLCERLSSLYAWLRERILHANLRGDARVIADAYEVVVDLHEAFSGAAGQPYAASAA